MYPAAVTFIKLALLFQYLRVFEVGSRTRVFCKFMIALTTVWGLAFIALRWVPCYPVAAYWDLSIQGARCWGYNARDPHSFMRLFVGQATSTAFLDLIVFAIPIQLCFRPDTPRNTKLCLLGLLVLGSMYVTSEHFFSTYSLPRRSTVLPDISLVLMMPPLAGLSHAQSAVWSLSFRGSQPTTSEPTQAGMVLRRRVWLVSRSILRQFAPRSPCFGPFCGRRGVESM